MDPQHDQVLPLQLVSEQDDAEARAIKSRLAVLVNLDDPSNVGPTQAAAEFDGWLMSEANRRLDIFLQRQGQDRYDVTLEEKQRLGTDSVRSLGPDTEGHLNDLFEGLAKLASSFPPFHPKQDRLLDFLTALAALPPRQAPNVTPLWRLYDGDELRVPDHPGWEMMNLWPFGDPGEDVTRLLVSSFEHEAEYVYSYDYSDIETLGSELRLRWRNFQSFAARLTVAHLADCRYICALGGILPSSQLYPDLETRPKGGPNRISGNAIAGAQWVLGGSHGRWVFQACHASARNLAGPDLLPDMHSSSTVREEQNDLDIWGIWNKDGWEGWKKQFLWIAQDPDGRFDSESRHVARLAHQQMESCEAEQEHVHG